MDVPPTVQDEQAVSRQLHSLSVRNLAHLAAALTQLGFELSRSSDPGTRQAANAFIGQVSEIAHTQRVQLAGNGLFILNGGRDIHESDPSTGTM